MRTIRIRKLSPRLEKRAASLFLLRHTVGLSRAVRQEIKRKELRPASPFPRRSPHGAGIRRSTGRGR
jgi:hypothetical protein